MTYLPAFTRKYLDLVHEMEEVERLASVQQIPDAAAQQARDDIGYEMMRLREVMTTQEIELTKSFTTGRNPKRSFAVTTYRFRKTLLALVLLALVLAAYNQGTRQAEASLIAVGYGPFTPETQELVEAECGYSMAEAPFYRYTQTRKGYLAMLKANEGVGDLYRCVKITTRAEQAPLPVSQSPAEWFSSQDDDYRFGHMDELPAADPGYTWAEDGTQVPYSYYSQPEEEYIQAEDGTYVPESFYSRTDYNRNGITDQEEGYPPNPNPADVY